MEMIEITHQCPHCNYEYGSPDIVKTDIYDPDDDSWKCKTGRHITYSNMKLSDDNDVSDKPSCRGFCIRVTLNCIKCGKESFFEVIEHKGYVGLSVRREKTSE